MDISDLTKHEKSVLLAKAMGNPLGLAQSPSLREFYPVNLYDPINMALAFQAVRWFGDRGYDDLLNYWFNEHFLLMEETMQQQMLDKILELAAEAGLVELEQEKE